MVKVKSAIVAWQSYFQDIEVDKNVF